MDILVRTGAIAEAEADAIIINQFQKTGPEGATAAVDAALDGSIGDLIEGGDFSGKAGEIAVLYPRGASAGPAGPAGRFGQS